MIDIRLHEGSRAPLQPFFEEADDSASQISSYRDFGDLLVATINDEIVGMALVIGGIASSSFELKSIAVRNGLRSQGIGGALVTAACDHAKARGGRKMLVATAAESIPALQFYQRHGFRIHSVVRDFYSAERGYRPLQLNGIALRDEVILDREL
jgi:ribosomal protein S18 acetylase RimI-like enzyme